MEKKKRFNEHKTKLVKTKQILWRLVGSPAHHSTTYSISLVNTIVVTTDSRRSKHRRLV